MLRQLLVVSLQEKYQLAVLHSLVAESALTASSISLKKKKKMCRQFRFLQAKDAKSAQSLLLEMIPEVSKHCQLLHLRPMEAQLTEPQIN